MSEISEHVRRTAAEKVRDIPRNCTCTWTWRKSLRRWVRTGKAPGCPWHLSNER